MRFQWQTAAAASDDSPRDEARPWLFLPFGLAPAVVVGYLTVGVVDGLARVGMPLSAVSLVLAALFIPVGTLFVWAPLVDLFGRRKHWLLAGVAVLCVAAAGLALTQRTPAGLPWLVALAAVAGIGYSLVSVSQKGLAVEFYAASRRVTAAGWAGAGSGIGLALGGGALGVGAHLSPLGVASLLLLLVGVPPIVSLLALERHRAVPPAQGATLGVVVNDTRRLLGSPRGRLAFAICLLPFATSGAALMVGAVGVDFDASVGWVGFWAGTGKALAFSAGALLGARLWQRTGTRVGYVVTGMGFVVFSLILLAMPKTPAGFAALACGCGLLQGAALSAILGIVLETVEQRAAATQAAVLVAAGNLSNVYLPPLAGWAHDTGGLSLLLQVDALVGLAGLGAYLLCARWLRQDPLRSDQRADSAG